MLKYKWLHKHDKIGHIYVLSCSQIIKNLYKFMSGEAVAHSFQ